MNKYIMTYDQQKFSFPILVTWYQLLVAMICLISLGYLGQYISALSFVPVFEFKLKVAQQVFPLTFIYVLMLTTNNLCLNYVEVSYFQIARSLSVVFQIILSYVMLGAITSPKALLACFVVCLGFSLGTKGELHFSWNGVFYGVVSSLFVALHGIYVKNAIKLVESEWKLALYNTTMSLVLMLPLIFVFGEYHQLVEQKEEVYEITKDIGFWIKMTVAGFLGFLINIAVFLQIKLTSPLSSVIIGASKSCVQSFLSILVFQNPISFMNGVGLVVTIFGSLYYSYVKHQEMNAKN
eukprot:TRINITY_DN348_c0_g1_i1.p1 TRINITY_DN348_c0_g1~~TRINITY_DN348_c0_g1_i1.p1  ORF type:complete len:294 (-),score=57.46 TRINITY_DN348_c0_g1_i1:187-1068(-)